MDHKVIDYHIKCLANNVLYEYELMRAGMAVWHGGWIKEWDPKIPRVSLLAGWSVDLPRGNFENQECTKSHLRSFCIAIKVSNLPEVCLSADVSKEKVPIYSMLLNVFEVGRASSVTCAYSLVSRWSLVRSSHPAFFRGDLVVKKHSTTFLSLPLIQEGQLSVTGERICTKYW